ncbi:hypothetical protein ILYODFUR_034573 [Ilyodon furcidens]|uniref:Uncharacterized protein n=1 Tax=Ilyodon furcidens TaxID=33524 RepID=A0ABV0UYQ5_9TELE
MQHKGLQLELQKKSLYKVLIQGAEYKSKPPKNVPFNSQLCSSVCSWDTLKFVLVMDMNTLSTGFSSPKAAVLKTINHPEVDTSPLIATRLNRETMDLKKVN